MAYGGSGPVHAASYGSDLGVPEIIVPLLAPVHSAYGAALSDIRFSLRFSDPLTLPVQPAKLEAIYVPMEAQGDERLASADVDRKNRRFERWTEARYRRQVHTVRVPVPASIRTEDDVKAIGWAFEAEYERLFGPGSGLKDAGIEFVDYGVDAIGVVEKPQPPKPKAGKPGEPRLRRPTYCPLTNRMVDTPIWEGSALPPGSKLTGPAVIEHPGTTVVLHSGHTARIDEFGNTRITIDKVADRRA
jgi:N-methylhydantoinase A